MCHLKTAEYSKIQQQAEVTLVSSGLIPALLIKISEKIYISELIMCYINQYE